MTQGDRERMLNALLRGVPAEPARIYQELEQMCTGDLDVLEPIIDEIVVRERRQAYGLGRMGERLSA